MVDLAQAVPEDQRADWLRRQANLEEVDRRISYAIRSGDLPIWVAPQGEPERLVATGALSTIDKRSICSGVFCPLSEEYKSGADRPWLWERPLFIKWADWKRFVASVQAEKNVAIPPDPYTPKLPPDEQFVTLSEALTFIAYDVSMNCDQLHEVLNMDRYGEHDPQEAIKAAVTKLISLARSERIAFQGKYRPSHPDEQRALLTRPIEPITFADYRQFNYLGDELRHGEGLTWWRDAKGVVNRLAHGGSVGSFIEVSVKRADLLREFRPDSWTGSQPDCIQWSDLDPSSLARAKQLASEAEADEWWNWPQALAWVGARSLELIASLRLSAESWKQNSPYDPAVALGAEHYLASGYLPDLRKAERDLQSAIERGAIRTLGRKTVDTPSYELAPLTWRGGKVVYTRTDTLVSAANVGSEWAFDIAVHRASLIAAFPIPTEAGDTIASVNEDAGLTHPPPEDVSFNDLERVEWMKAQPMGSADAAHKTYKLHPRFCGTKLPEFRKEWGRVKGTKRGRPRKQKIDG